MVPKAGLEPARLSPLPPQDSVSTNSTTSASFVILNRRSGIQLICHPRQGRQATVGDPVSIQVLQPFIVLEIHYPVAAMEY